VGTQTYAFRYTRKVFGNLFNADTPESTALSAIEDTLTKGHEDYLAGRLQDAINDYKQAASLVYAQLHPAGSAGTGAVSRDPSLFGPLLSLGLEWMNVLQPTVPLATSRPRVPVTPEMLGDAASFDNAGLRSQVVDAGINADAIADWQFAQTLSAQSNAPAAQVFLMVAQKESPELIKQLQSPVGDVQAGPGDGVVPGAAPVQAPGGRAAAAAGVAIQVDGAGPVPRVSLPPELTVRRAYGTVVDKEVKQVTWNVGDGPDLG